MSRSYVRFHDGEDRSLICFPWSGAGARPFRSWKPAAPAGLALAAARHGGREDRSGDPAPSEWAPLVADLTDDLEVADDGPPFVFFGHCLGALLAFEVTRELRRRGRALPERLLVAGDTPARSTDVPPVDDVKAAMRASGAVSERILANAEVFALFEPAIRADLGLASRYRYAAEPPLTVPIDVFVASADVESHAVAGEWGAETTGDLRVIAVEGDSLYPHGAWAGLASAVFAAAGRTGAGRGGFR